MADYGFMFRGNGWRGFASLDEARAMAKAVMRDRPHTWHRPTYWWFPDESFNNAVRYDESRDYVCTGGYNG